MQHKRYTDIYLLGDLNMDHTHSKLNDNANTLISTLKSMGLTQVISNPTRRTATTQTILDVVDVKSHKDIIPFINPTSLSDHYLVGITSKLNDTPTKQKL